MTETSKGLFERFEEIKRARFDANPPGPVVARSKNIIIYEDIANPGMCSVAYRGYSTSAHVTEISRKKKKMLNACEQGHTEDVTVGQAQENLQRAVGDLSANRIHDVEQATGSMTHFDCDEFYKYYRNELLKSGFLPADVDAAIAFDRQVVELMIEKQKLDESMAMPCIMDFGEWGESPSFLEYPENRANFVGCSTIEHCCKRIILALHSEIKEKCVMDREYGCYLCQNCKGLLHNSQLKCSCGHEIGRGEALKNSVMFTLLRKLKRPKESVLYTLTLIDVAGGRLKDIESQETGTSPSETIQ
jgi:hypothetical protein